MNEDDDPPDDKWPFEQRIEAAAGWLTLRDWQEAKRELDKITNLKIRKRLEVLKAYAEVWEMSGDHAAMARYMEVLVLYEPGEIDHRLRLNAALLALGRLDEARQFIEGDLKQHPDHPALLFKLAITLCMMQKHGEAEWVLVQLFTLKDGKYERTYLGLALDWPELAPLRENLLQWQRELDAEEKNKNPGEDPEVSE